MALLGLGVNPQLGDFTLLFQSCSPHVVREEAEVQGACLLSQNGKVEQLRAHPTSSPPRARVLPATFYSLSGGNLLFSSQQGGHGSLVEGEHWTVVLER